MIAAPSAANAAPTSRLVYSRGAMAEACPSEDEVRRAVAQRVGYDPFFGWAQRTIVASLTRGTASGFVATLSLVDEHGVDHGARALHTEGACADLLEPVALAIAIAIDPHALAPRPPAPAPVAPPPEPPPPPPPATEPPPAPAPVPPAVVPRRMGLVFEADVGAVASVGVAPLPAMGVAAGVAGRWRELSIELEGRVDAPVSVRARGGGAVSSWLAAGTLLACWRAWPLFGCALGQVGSIQAQSQEVTPQASGTALWLGAGARVGVMVALPRDIALRVRSDVVCDLAPPTLWLNGQPAWPAPKVASSLGADIVATFR